MTDERPNPDDWHEHPNYFKMKTDEKCYQARTERCKGCCGWTALILSVILFSPLVYFAITCWLK